ncbi:tail fiber protein [Pedobacter sp. PLR]|uniref:phage tail protein n=1 Tax=Pedobacter sp. PLR TaxID=2994465 RepID=UPI002247DFE4|nr:tail fiber protein [Pedobacter sp. PLR]MCX2453397.1 tail fiber protein [Pedobacter sp. PLR]
MEDYLGTIRAFAGNFTPRGFAPCNGQLLPIGDNQALFALLGTIYGGNGQDTFALPDLRGRSMVGIGQGPGLSNYDLGQRSGTETTTILITNMPSHNHAAVSTAVLNVSDQKGNITVPAAGNAIAAMVDTNTDAVSGYTAQAPKIPMAGASVTTNTAPVGGGLPIPILQPTLAITYCICISGMFPSRN